MTLKRTISNSFDEVDQIINIVEENPKRIKLTETVNQNLIKPTPLPSEMVDHILSFIDNDDIQLNWMTVCKEWKAVIDDNISRGRIRVEFDTGSLPNGIDKESLIGILETSPSVRCINHVVHSCSGDSKVINAIFSNRLFVETKLKLQLEDEEDEDDEEDDDEDNVDRTRRFRLTLHNYFNLNQGNLTFIKTLLCDNSLSDLIGELFISHPNGNVPEKKMLDISKVIVAIIKIFKNLKSVSLIRVLNENRFAEIIPILSDRRVEELILKENGIDSLPDQLLGMGALPIKILDLTGNSIGEEMLLELLTCDAFSNVQELILRDCEIEGLAGGDSTDEPKFSMKSLKILDLSGNTVEVDVIEKLIAEFSGSLKDIRLSNMALDGEDHLELLKSLSSASNLTSVDISNNSTFNSEELLELIEHLKEHCKIEHVYISGIDVGERTAALIVSHFRRRGIDVKYNDEESDDESDSDGESDDGEEESDDE